MWSINIKVPLSCMNIGSCNQIRFAHIELWRLNESLYVHSISHTLGRFTTRKCYVKLNYLQLTVSRTDYTLCCLGLPVCQYIYLISLMGSRRIAVGGCYIWSNGTRNIRYFIIKISCTQHIIKWQNLWLISILLFLILKVILIVFIGR